MSAIPVRGQVIAARSNLPGCTCGAFTVVAFDGRTLDIVSPVGTRLSVPWRPWLWHTGADPSSPLFSNGSDQ